MDVAVIGTLIPIVMTIATVITIIYIRKFQNLERMAIIDKGMDPAIFKKESATAGTLRASLLFIGSGVGLLFGHILSSAWNVDEVTAYFSMILIFGGLGLGLAYIIEEKKMKKQ